MAKKNEALFEESSQGAVSAVSGIVFILGFLLAMGGFVVMSYAFGPGLGDPTHNGLWIFSGGLVMSFLGFGLPFAVLPATGK